jgi:hypothetical protein
MVAQGVNDFVLQDAYEPGFQLGPVAKGLRLGQSRQHGFRHRIFSPCVVSKLEAGKTHQVILMLDQLLLKRSCGRGAHGQGCSGFGKGRWLKRQLLLSLIMDK